MPGNFYQPVPLVYPSGSANFVTYFGDMNNDGCTDAVANNTTVYISGCDGSAPAQSTLANGVVGVMDWNGDGLSDILVSNGTTLGVYEVTTNGLSALISTSLSSSNSEYEVVDAKGDGLQGLVAMSGTTILYWPHNSPAGQPPDLLTSITDSYGNSASPTYVSIAQSNYTNFTDAIAGYMNYVGPLYVVNNVTISDPSSTSGGTYTQSYS